MYTQISRPGPCIVTISDTILIRLDQILSMKRGENKIYIEFMRREAVSEYTFETAEIAKSCFTELTKAMKAWLDCKDTLE